MSPAADTAAAVKLKPDSSGDRQAASSSRA